MTKEKALGVAARCWCTEETRGKIFDEQLAEAFSEALLDAVNEETRALSNDLYKAVNANEKLSKLLQQIEGLKITRAPIIASNMSYLNNCQYIFVNEGIVEYTFKLTLPFVVENKN